MRKSTLRLTGLVLALGLVCLPLATSAEAQSGQRRAPVVAQVDDLLEVAGIEPGAESLRAPSGDGSNAFGAIIVSTTVPALDAQTPMTGYAAPPIGIVYTWTGGAISATEDAVVLDKNGTYQVQLTGALTLHNDDESDHPRAGASFFIIVDGRSLPNVACNTPMARHASTRPTSTVSPGNPYRREFQCTVTGTIQVRNQGGSGPFVFGKGAQVQAFVVPDERFALGDATVWWVRMEITKLGD